MTIFRNLTTLCSVQNNNISELLLPIGTGGPLNTNHIADIDYGKEFKINPEIDFLIVGWFPKIFLFRTVFAVILSSNLDWDKHIASIYHDPSEANKWNYFSSKNKMTLLRDVMLYDNGVFLFSSWVKTSRSTYATYKLKIMADEKYQKHFEGWKFRIILKTDGKQISIEDAFI